MKGEKILASLSPLEGNSIGRKTKVCKGVVEDVVENVFCTINFLDYTTSHDSFLSDLKRCECQYFNCRGTHFPGALVKNFWNTIYVYWQYMYNVILIANVFYHFMFFNAVFLK